MYAKKKTLSVLTLLPPVSEPAAPSVSRIPEIRTGLRHQVKMLRSTSVAVMMLGAFTALFLWISAEPYQAIRSLYDTFVLSVMCLGVLLIAAILSLLIYFCANEVEDQIRKLSKEV